MIGCLRCLFRGHVWVITRTSDDDALWLERACIVCRKVRLNGQVPRIPMPGPRLTWAQEMVLGKVRKENAFKEALRAERERHAQAMGLAGPPIATSLPPRKR